MNRRDFIRNTAVGAGALAVGGYSGSVRSSDDRPNIVIIMADDLGLGDLSCFGSTYIKTPNLDAMAAGGVKLTNFYSCAPVCSPSRSGVMTGQYPIRNGVITNFGPSRQLYSPFAPLVNKMGHGLSLSEITLAEALKPLGYATACVGKWHLGDYKRYLPTNRGFDQYFGIPYSNDMEPVVLLRDEEVIERPVDQDTLTQRYTREALEFIEKNQNQPFLLYYPQTFPHVPLHASGEFRDKSAGGRYGDTIEELEWSVGQILESLDRLGIAENTFVFFTSDNGPWYQGSPGGHRDRKMSVFEGGFRVPGIARWPGVLQEGLVSDAPAVNVDLFPTSVKLAGGTLPQDRVIDGQDLMPVLKGGATAHEAIYYCYHDNLQAVRKGKWKYHRRHKHWTTHTPERPRGPMLFNIIDDSEESYDLINLYPDKAAELEGIMKEWEKTLPKGPRRFRI
jgi:arylsulfatase A